MARVNAGRESVGSAYAKPYDIFDMIGGTSTGGIIAIMLGRLEMDVEEYIVIYQALISKIFKGKESRTGLSFGLKIKPKFSSAVLEAEMKNTISNRQGFSEDDLLDNGKERGCKVLVCATAKETVGIARLKSYTNVGETGKLASSEPRGS
ncbi:hypothetical protein J1614_011439 [Plenodomus biglobosus]|nr:hypothetical protein J1614_011439 [Plenodomus biglobosus]